MTRLTEKQVQRNIQAVAAAIEQYEREGTSVPMSTVADLRRAARGQMNTDDVIRNIYRRFKGDTTKLAELVRDNLLRLDHAISAPTHACGQASRTHKLERTRS